MVWEVLWVNEYFCGRKNVSEGRAGITLTVLG